MLRRRFVALLGCVLTTACVSLPASAQMDKKAPLSPPEKASVMLNGKAITIDYSAPSMRGRKIMGGLVPWDKEWRTGANAATTLKTAVNLKIGSLSVPAGTYTLYSIPSQSSWRLIVNKQTGQWGTMYDPTKDLGRVDMMNGTAPSSPVEMFQIKFENTSGNKTELHLVWDKTDVYVPVTAE
ncbi:DUF2911 domain-containing protein [Acidipila rosea]|uniref:DUF2911 family protein n=1 Tax=Acidipila rosea TaxID=768535 RepID=A0A4R1L4N9_9BACT|nr:DUF2911 domain-containing protein [Acidipila rosea]TCK72010.1 hypothetical protein C7378_2641 [Acidipila rosea]